MKGRCMILAALLSALAVGCGGEEKSAPAGTSYAGTLAVDIKGTADVTLAVAPDGALDVTLDVHAKEAEGLVGSKLSAKGRVEAFPENDSELYAAKLSAPATAGGPCGKEPVSLGLSLHRRGKNERVGGSLAAYCGEGKYHGVPVRILRLTGSLPPR